VTYQTQTYLWDSKHTRLSYNDPWCGFGRWHSCPQQYLFQNIQTLWYTKAIFKPCSGGIQCINQNIILTTHTHTHTRLTPLCPGLPGSAGTRKVKPIWILLEHFNLNTGIDYLTNISVASFALDTIYTTLMLELHSLIIIAKKTLWTKCMSAF